MVSSGSGDCWAMSDYLYSKLSAAGITSRIVQYSTSYSSRHRSVQLYGSNGWYDVPYSSYGYSTMANQHCSTPLRGVFTTTSLVTDVISLLQMIPQLKYGQKIQGTLKGWI